MKTAGSFSPTYDPITSDMSVKTSITYTHSNSHTHLEWLTRWLHTHIATAQLLDIWHSKQLEGPDSIIQSQSCNRARSDCDDLPGNIISSGQRTCLLFPSCHAASGRAIDTLSICLPVSIFYDLLQWLTPFMRAATIVLLLGLGKTWLSPSDIIVSDASLICKSVNAMHKVIDVVSMATM